MCFEFTYPRTGPVIDQLTAIVGADNFFMICVGNRNYLYLSDIRSIDVVKGFLLLQGIVIFKISQPDMMKILSLSDTMPIKHFFGSKTLCESFKIYFENIG